MDSESLSERLQFRILGLRQTFNDRQNVFRLRTAYVNNNKCDSHTMIVHEWINTNNESLLHLYDDIPCVLSLFDLRRRAFLFIDPRPLRRNQRIISDPSTRVQCTDDRFCNFYIIFLETVTLPPSQVSFLTASVRLFPLLLVLKAKIRADSSRRLPHQSSIHHMPPEDHDHAILSSNHISDAGGSMGFRSMRIDGRGAENFALAGRIDIQSSLLGIVE